MFCRSFSLCFVIDDSDYFLGIAALSVRMGFFFLLAFTIIFGFIASSRYGVFDLGHPLGLHLPSFGNEVLTLVILLAFVTPSLGMRSFTSAILLVFVALFSSDEVFDIGHYLGLHLPSFRNEVSDLNHSLGLHRWE